MSSWAGFSEEELQRLQQKESAMVRGRKPAQAGRNRQQLQRERALQLSAQKNFVAPGLPPEQQLAKPPQKVACQPAAAPAAPAVAEVDKPKIGKENWSEGLQPAAEGRASSEVKELEKQEVELREKTRLEQLQQEQKIIEERNRQKKALLTKTIAEKSKQTQAEAVKLKRIQKELQALDDMVSNDIGILRGRIEEASWDFTAARKRYQRAEAEYVTAKLDLHKKTEVKEQLAEHLCAIIQQNELRKAHKLEELMKQLQLEASEEELERLRIQEEEEKRRIQEEGDKKLQQEEGDKKLQQQQQEQEEEEKRRKQQQEEEEEKRRKQQQHGENLQEEEKVCEREEKSGEKGLKHQNGVQDSMTTGEVKVTEASERSDEGEEITRMVENGHQSEGGSSS